MKHKEIKFSNLYSEFDNSPIFNISVLLIWILIKEPYSIFNFKSESYLSIEIAFDSIVISVTFVALKFKSNLLSYFNYEIDFESSYVSIIYRSLKFRLTYWLLKI